MPKFALMRQEDPMSTLCRMVVGTKYEDLPSNVVDVAKSCIMDTIAVTVAGSTMEGIPAVVDLVRNKGQKAESAIPFYGGKVPASEAAFAIAPMARATDFGLLHEEAGHPVEYTVPTILAATGLRDRVSGKEFLTAFVVAQEMFIRIGIAGQTLKYGVSRGRASGHGIFGAVAAAGKLLYLSLEELGNAEGIGREMLQPLDIAMHSPATLMMRVHHGFVCQDAINACLLAKRGITGPRQEVLLPPRGYLGLFSDSWEIKPEVLTDNLGEKWEMLNVMLKPYPCCKCIHTAIGGILDQMEEHNFEADDIANIDIDASTVNWNITCVPKELKWNPKTMVDCQFSMPYPVATVAYDKKFSFGAYTPEAIARKDVRELMNKISAREDKSLPPWANRVTTTLNDHRKYSKEYIYVKGHPKNPFTRYDLIDKFKECAPYSAYKLNDEVVDLVIEALLNLEEVEDVVSAIILPLTPK